MAAIISHTTPRGGSTPPPTASWRRWSNVRLTPDGREAFETIRDARHEALAAIISSWTPEEAALLVKVIARLADAVRVHNLEAHLRDLERRRRAARERPPDVQEEERRRARERHAQKKEAEAQREAEREWALQRRQQVVAIPGAEWAIW